MLNLRIYKKAELEGTVYIELAQVKKGEPKPLWAEDSLYFSDTSFSYLFSFPFHNSSENYDLFGFAELSELEAKKLIIELEKNKESISKLTSLKDLKMFGNRKGNEYNFEGVLPEDESFPDYDSQVSDFVKDMQSMNTMVLNYVKETVEKSMILQVRGL